MVKVLGMCGSLRKGSFNRKLLKLAGAYAAEAGAEYREVDLETLNLPAYNGDIEEKGFPDPVKTFKAEIEWSDVLLIASPEYNYSVSGVLKNAIDWASRGVNSFGGRVAAVFGASSGSFGTVRGQNHLRTVFECVNVRVLPQPQVFVRSAAEAFNTDGSLKDEKLAQTLKTLVVNTIAFIKK